MFVKLDQFQKYSNVYTDNTEMQQSYIDTAQNIIENYLGYKLPLAIYTHTFNGNGTNELQLRAKPIKNIIKVIINEQEIPVSQFHTREEFIYYDNRLFPIGNRNIFVIYEAGWEEHEDAGIISGLIDGVDAFNDTDNLVDGTDAFTSAGTIINGGDAFGRETRNFIPSVIVSCILRIATLLQTEADSNIGVTSKSFADSGSRTFYQFTDFNKYLITLSRYALLRI